MFHFHNRIQTLSLTPPSVIRHALCRCTAPTQAASPSAPSVLPCLSVAGRTLACATELRRTVPGAYSGPSLNKELWLGPPDLGCAPAGVDAQPGSILPRSAPTTGLGKAGHRITGFPKGLPEQVCLRASLLMEKQQAQPGEQLCILHVARTHHGPMS